MIRMVRYISLWLIQEMNEPPRIVPQQQKSKPTVNVVVLMGYNIRKKILNKKV
jgi:hypothetical protein